MSAWSMLQRAFGWGGVIAFHGLGRDPHLPVMHVSPERFESQLRHLKDSYSVVSLRELLARWRVRGSTNGCVAITFDDAYAGVLKYALPVLRALDLPATVFVTSDHALRGAAYWWDSVELERLAVRADSWTDAPQAVGLPACDSHDPLATDRIRSRVLARFAGRWPEPLVATADSDWRSMTFTELATLGSDQRIEFGVHTVTHPALPFLSFDEQVAEMEDNLRALRQHLPRVLPVVAYPYGLYDPTTLRAARAAGMSAGFTMEGRAAAERPSLMTIPRVGSGEAYAPSALARKLNRALRPALVIRNRGIHPRLPRDPLAGRLQSAGPQGAFAQMREL